MTGAAIFNPEPYITVVRLDKDKYTFDFASCAEPKETLGAFYNRQEKKPDFLINGGFFRLADGKPVYNFRDENTDLSTHSFWQGGFGINGLGEMVYGLASYRFRDFLSGYPVLAAEGKNVRGGYAREIDGAHPRSALGLAAGHYFIVAADGRGPGRPGMTLDGLADFMISLGCTYAINLDGGGSTRLLRGGEVLNRPTEDRAVDNVVCAYRREEGSLRINDAALRFTRPLTKRTSTTAVVLHHRAGEGDVESIHRQHLANGWAGIGYNFYIRYDGSVYEGRGWENIGAHAGSSNGYNKKSLGLCFEGNYDTKADMPDAQYRAGVALIREALARYPAINEIVGHRDLAATACPGRHFPLERMAAEARGTAAKAADEPGLTKDAAYAKGKKYLVSVGSMLNLRAKPETDSAVLEKLPDGAPVMYFGWHAGDDWYCVRTQSGRTGYVSTRYIRAADKSR